MNKVILIGRLCTDVETRYTQGQNATAVSRYRLAVNRRFSKDGEDAADYINCVAFGKSGEFAEKYLQKGMKICVVGRIQTGSYTDRDGKKVYTTDVIVEEHEFVESKAKGASEPEPDKSPYGHADSDGFMNVPDDMDDLPFN